VFRLIMAVIFEAILIIWGYQMIFKTDKLHEQYINETYRYKLSKYNPFNSWIRSPSYYGHIKLMGFFAWFMASVLLYGIYIYIRTQF